MNSIHCISEHLGLKRIWQGESFLLKVIAQPSADSLKPVGAGQIVLFIHMKKKAISISISEEDSILTYLRGLKCSRSTRDGTE